MSENVVTRKHGVLFFEYERNMVASMTGAMKSTQYSALSCEGLVVFYGKLALGSTVLMYLGIGTKLEQVLDTTDVVRVPMGD